LSPWFDDAILRQINGDSSSVMFGADGGALNCFLKKKKTDKE
jgi:hypothetical protein